MQVKGVLCVCTGNICRSPLAEGLFRRDMPWLTTTSAGLGAVVGGRMPEPARRIAQREGLDLDGHRGRQIDSKLLRSRELVLVMEAGQKLWLSEQFPESRDRLFIISHWRGGADVEDPFRKSADVFERIFLQIEQSVTDWASRLGPRPLGT